MFKSGIWWVNQTVSDAHGNIKYQLKLQSSIPLHLQDNHSKSSFPPQKKIK